MLKNSNRGISTLVAIGIIAVLVVVIGGGILGYQYLSSQKNNNQQNNQNQNQQQTQPNNQTNNAQSSIAVISPNGGETWKPGETHDITWRSTGVDNVVIWLAKKGASDVAEIITGSSNVAASLGKYTWTIPTNNNDINLGGEFKITVGNADLSNQYVRDASDNYFNITARVVDQTAGWKTYTNTQYGYSIKYPSDWSYSTSNGLTLYCDYPKRNYEPCTGLEGIGIGDINPGVQIGIEQKSLEDFKKDYVIRTQEDYILDGVRGVKIVGGPIIGMGVDYNIIFVTKNNINYKVISPSNPPTIDNQIISTFKFTK